VCGGPLARILNLDAELVMQGEATQEQKLELLKYRFTRKFTAEGAARAAEVWNRMFVCAEGAKRTLEQTLKMD
jgi:hypothetical protein